MTQTPAALASRIVREFRPEGWPAKEAELARLLERNGVGDSAAALWQPMSTLTEQDGWVVGRVDGWDPDNHTGPPYFVGKLYDLRASALLDPWSGRWKKCSGWTRLTAE